MWEPVGASLSALTRTNLPSSWEPADLSLLSVLLLQGCCSQSVILDFLEKIPQFPVSSLPLRFMISAEPQEEEEKEEEGRRTAGTGILLGLWTGGTDLCFSTYHWCLFRISKMTQSTSERSGEQSSGKVYVGITFSGSFFVVLESSKIKV